MWVCSVGINCIRSQKTSELYNKIKIYFSLRRGVADE